MNNIKFDFETIDNIILDGSSDNNYPSFPSQEHYKLLAYLSGLFSNKHIIIIGTSHGYNALALSQTMSNHIYAFDTKTEDALSLQHKTNVSMIYDDLFNETTRNRWQDIILRAPLIVIDTDQQNGKKEYEFYNWLREHHYNGLILCSNIWHNKEIRDNFWFQIPGLYKRDISRYGKWTGTGLISFTPNDDDYGKDWTFVTGYFNLVKQPDASKEIRDRPDEFYLQSANATMGIDTNLVVYCEEEYYQELERLRPDHLKHKTRYIICEFSDFPLHQYYDTIIENRKMIPSADPRNTASYYLFCMARYHMIKQIIEENPFNSTHFAWINICIERYGYKNIMALEDIMRTKRDKFSTCYIDFISREMVANLPEYFKWGRCSLCSGFFTGNAEYFQKFCDLIEEQFMIYLRQGYGHADEQLYSAIYFEHPEIFEVYFGDYLSMITNYIEIVDHIETVVHFLIRNSYQHKEWDLCYKACLAVDKYCEGDPSILGNLKEGYIEASIASAIMSGDLNFAKKSLVEKLNN